MLKTFMALFLTTALGACSTLEATSAVDFKLDDADFIEAVYVPTEISVDQKPLERIEPLALPGHLKPIKDRKVAAVPKLRPDLAIDRANASAAVEPDQNSFINAIQIYPYTVGALYQVYSAPKQVTDIALQPGEDLISVSAGDTVNWILGDTVSGIGDKEQVHILIKPIAPGLTTNLIITTSKRTYHVDLKSFRETYMAGVSWRYPHEALVRQRATARARSEHAAQTVERRLQVDRLNFRYEIKGDRPHWRPLRAFDDGRKVFIQFPDRLDQGEAPPLFVVGRNGQSQLVNYRIKGSYYVVDRLFGAAELRLGEKNQSVVRIVRRKSRTGRLAEDPS